ncbi:MAG: putative toxin-antitoxin system toxin component, PIN family [Candidatus Omnitrophota bacterium]
MKILFDTNVIISGFVSQGYSFDVIKDAANKHEVYCTEYLLKETRESLSTKFPLSQEAINSIINTVKKQFIEGKTANTVEKISRDPEDDQILADAVANDIDIIITGDKDLLVLKTHKGIKIIHPNKYWNL